MKVLLTRALKPSDWSWRAKFQVQNLATHTLRDRLKPWGLFPWMKTTA